MEKVLNFVRSFLFRCIGWIPMRLPVGVPAWNQYCQVLLSSYGYPDLPSYRHALADMIMRLPQECTRKSPRWFAVRLLGAQSKQTAWQEIDQQRQANDAARKAALVAIEKGKSDSVVAAAPELAAKSAVEANVLKSESGKEPSNAIPFKS